MVVGQRERQHQPRHKGIAIPDRLAGAARQAEDSDLRGVDDRREAGPADTAQAGDGKARAENLGNGQLAGAGRRAEMLQFPGDLAQPLLVGVADDRHHQPLRGVDGDAEMAVALERHLIAARQQRAVEERKVGQRRRHRLDDEDQRAVGRLRLAALAVQGLAQLFQPGDIRLLEVGDAGDGRPAGGQAEAGDFLDAAQGHRFHRPKFAIIIEGRLHRGLAGGCRCRVSQPRGGLTLGGGPLPA